MPVIHRLVEKRRIENKFATELSLLNGENPSKSDHTSIIHFSLNKSATQYVKRIFCALIKESEMVPVHIQDYAFASKLPYLDTLSVEEMKQYKHIFKPSGYLYSVFGGMVKGIDLDQYKVMLMVRDPRDILVSHYYSWAYSHPEPTSFSSKYQSFHHKRSQVQQMTVDEYAFLSWEKVKHVLEQYRDLLLSQNPKVYVTKYEEMVANFEQWLNNLIHACELEVSQSRKDLLVQQHYASLPKAENQGSQLRKGVSGDYKNKLSNETIMFLSEKLSDVLKYYKYA